MGQSHTRTRPFPVAPVSAARRRRGGEILRIVSPPAALATDFPASVPYEVAVETERYFAGFSGFDSHTRSVCFPATFHSLATVESERSFVLALTRFNSWR